MIHLQKVKGNTARYGIDLAQGGRGDWMCHGCADHRLKQTRD